MQPHEYVHEWSLSGGQEHLSDEYWRATRPWSYGIAPNERDGAERGTAERGARPNITVMSATLPISGP
ncbi:hypothetical protein GCM10022204_29190 [Microlunatus aurantiacus]|uniref:Uncharacterized protein n=1 Tax=Microlunatus aurantiacus TaxID=446786 RepID=A0ABP7DT25_9ACTN